MKDVKLSYNLKLSEVTKSQTAIRRGILNVPSPDHLNNLEQIALNIFQPIRDHFGTPIGISSGYRSGKLNRAIGGSARSQHSKGQALDIDGHIYGLVDNHSIFNFIKNNLEFDQLIAEFKDGDDIAWVHVSYVSDKNRNQVLIAFKNQGKTEYLPYTEEAYKRIYGIPKQVI